MKELTPQDYPVIKELAKKYGIRENNIKIFFTELGEYEFLIELKNETSAFQQLQFQKELSKKIGTDGEEIGVVTAGGLKKREQAFKITPQEMGQIQESAQLLKDFLNIADAHLQEASDDKESFKLKL